MKPGRVIQVNPFRLTQTTTERVMKVMGKALTTGPKTAVGLLICAGTLTAMYWKSFSVIQIPIFLFFFKEQRCFFLAHTPQFE